MLDISNQLKLFISSKRWMKKYFRPLMPEMAYVQVDSEFKMYLSMIDISGPSFDLSYDKTKAFFKYEQADKDLIEPHINDNDSFFDVGANIGHFSFYLKKKYPNLNCFLFEPMPWLSSCIEKTIGYNSLNNMKLHSVALSNQNGEAEFHIDTFNDGGHSLIKDKLSARSKVGRSVMVKLQCFDDYDFPKVDFIKVDVQGAENNFIKGALKSIKKFHPKMLIEVSASESLNFLDFLEAQTGIKFNVYSSEKSGILSREDLRELIYIFSERKIEDCNYLFIPQES